MNNPKMRLSLRRETVRTLDESELGRVVGGAVFSLGCCTGDNSSCVSETECSGQACSNLYGDCGTIANSNCGSCEQYPTSLTC